MMDILISIIIGLGIFVIALLITCGGWGGSGVRPKG